MNRITALLTVYRRPYTLQRQLQAIRCQSLPPDALWCFVQEPSLELSQEIHCSGFDRVIECTPNSFYHFRFAVALAAQTDFVAIFDDDAIPGSRWFENCLRTFSHSPGILGTHGTRLKGIQNSQDYRHRERLGWISPSDFTQEVDYVGQVWFTKPEWLRFLFADRLATDRNGEDIELSARAWRLAGIPSYCPPHPFNETELWGCQDNVLNQDENASSRRPTWAAERMAIIQTEISAGWRLTSMR
ncbi:glycosyltransferase family 2 protein [Planctomicrobium sp. SH527]|uniref:glycosyltransferase family 2 protein n=1 Tax=Planctomicrobium sp. SH527 TaxID=3448123 RepID=UPI003F5CB323